MCSPLQRLYPACVLICILNYFWSFTVQYTPVRYETISVIVCAVLVNAVQLRQTIVIPSLSKTCMCVYTYFKGNVTSQH